jgi:threonine dehydrogenase-like Zn-dependent dehydrogenase
VPDELLWEVAVAIEPLAGGIHGAERANIQFGDIVVVMGGGSIGLLMRQAAKLKNPMLLILGSFGSRFYRWHLRY